MSHGMISYLEVQLLDSSPTSTTPPGVYLFRNQLHIIGREFDQNVILSTGCNARWVDQVPVPQSEATISELLDAIRAKL